MTTITGIKIIITVMDIMTMIMGITTIVTIMTRAKIGIVLWARREPAANSCPRGSFR